MKKLWGLKYWETGEWQVIEERYNDQATEDRQIYCPTKQNLFTALKLCNPESTRVCILGQDPYPSKTLAMGVAFSVPRDCRSFPPTLKNIFKEYETDLHYPIPTQGDLTPWCSRGVFLWNVIPSVQTSKPLSHIGWEEWKPLTEEIIDVLDKSGHCVFATLGSVARDSFFKKTRNSDCIVTSHPSPRGSINSRSPFIGSRLFTTINSKLCEQGLDPIDWRLE